MNFDQSKKDCLQREDKSMKQSVDADIVGLIALINKHPDYFTTSSCSGRITLVTLGARKDEGKRLFITHELLTKKDRQDIKGALETPTEETVWLRSEPFIIHIACRTIQNAEELLDLGNKFFKRSGILSTTHKIVVELRGSHFLETPLKTAEVNENYLNFLLDEADTKLKQTKEKTKEFTAAFSSR